MNIPPSATRRGRGRPPGSKNKPKESEATTTAEAPKPRTQPLPRQRGKKDYRTGIEGTLILVGDLVGKLVNPTDGALIQHHAKDIAEGWDRLAQENASVAKVLDSMTGSSAWGAALMPTFALTMGIAANHGLLDGIGSRLGGLLGAAAVPSEDASASDHPTG